MNKYLIFGGVTITLAVLLFLVTTEYIKVKEDRNRVRNNQTSLLKDFEVNKEENKAITNKLILSQKELKDLVKSNSELSDKLNRAEIKVKRLESIIQTKLEVDIEIKEVFKDSIINLIDTIRCLKIENKFILIDICDDIDSKNLIKIPIELEQFGEIIPKKFLWVRWRLWGIEGVKSTIVTDNPYVKIKYNRFIEIKK